MAYKIGTRVKKVRGINIGTTGTVVGGRTVLGLTLGVCQLVVPEADMLVRRDGPWIARDGTRRNGGDVGWAISSAWEPIIPDGHRAGVKGECSLLDELLSRENNNETVK